MSLPQANPKRANRIDKGAIEAARTGVKAKKKATSRETLDKQWATAVKVRDYYKCVKCGGYFQVQAHHAYPRLPRYLNLRHVLANGCTLCAQCHTNAHQDMKGFRAWYATVSPEFAAIYEKQGEVK